MKWFLSRSELTADVLLYVLGVIPLFIFLTIGTTCQFDGEIETGCMFGETGTSLAQGVGVYFLILAFGGFTIVIPMLLIAGVVSLVLKIKRYSGRDHFRILYSPAFLILYLFCLFLLVNPFDL